MDKQEVGQDVARTDRGIGGGGNVESLGAVEVVDAGQGDAGAVGGVEGGQKETGQAEAVGTDRNLGAVDRTGQTGISQEVVEMEVEEGGDGGGSGKPQDKQGERRVSKREKNVKDFFL